MLRAAILAQGGASSLPVDSGGTWELDVSRSPAGYTLSDANQTAINTSGGSDYRRWVPSAKAIRPPDGRRYWEVLCAPDGAASFNGYLGVVSAELRDAYDAGENPIILGSIGYRGNGSLWSSNTTSTSLRLSGLASFGAGDVVMFVFDPASASLWVGVNGVWRDDPGSDPPTWSAGGSSAFYPQIQGRDAGDGGTLRSLPEAFSYPVPSGVRALGFEEPDLSVFEVHAFLEIGWDRSLSLAAFEPWLEYGGGMDVSVAQASLYIEVETS